MNKENEVMLKGKVNWFQNLVKGDRFDNYTCEIVIPSTDENLLKVIALAKSLNPHGQVSKGLPITKSEDGKFFTVKVKSHSKSKTKDGKEYSRPGPMIINSEKQIISGSSLENLRVGNGSVCKVKIEMQPYENSAKGVAFRPIAVQVLEIVEFVETKKEIDLDDFEFVKSDKPSEKTDEQKLMEDF